MKKEKNNNIIERQNTFIAERPVFANHNTDPLAVIELLRAEIDEFVEAYKDEQSAQEIAREAADILIFTLTLFTTLGLNVEKQVHSKIARNEAKYPRDLFQEGDFIQRAAIAKKRWIQLGGDRAFYSSYSVSSDENEVSIEE